jgi:putative transposase
VFATKHRRQVFIDAIPHACERTMRAVAFALDVDLVEFNGEADHIHLLVAYPPSLAVSTLVNRLKGATTRRLRHMFTGHCNRARIRGHIWSPPYIAGSCDRAPLTITKQYIAQQQRPA